jgi:ribosome-associated heat shock protein Hsp15
VPRRRPAEPDSEARADGELRIDRWLWHARFYRSRALASAAVSAGQVRLNGERVKASRAVRAGDRLALNVAGRLVEIDVRALPVRRGPAPEARTAYVETEESLARAVQYAAQQRLGAYAAPRPDGRPDKRARRQLRALGRAQGGGDPEPWPPYDGDGFADRVAATDDGEVWDGAGFSVGDPGAAPDDAADRARSGTGEAAGDRRWQGQAED